MKVYRSTGAIKINTNRKVPCSCYKLGNWAKSIKIKSSRKPHICKKKSTFTSHVFLKFYTELLIGLSDTEVMQLTHQINCQVRSQSTNNPRIAAPCCFSTTAVRGCFTVELPRQSVHSLLCYCAGNSVLVQLPELRTSN